MSCEEHREILSWRLLEAQGYGIAELKKQIKCRKCGNIFDMEKEFFGYRSAAFQTVISQEMAKNKQEILLRDYAFSHFGC